MPPSRLNYFSDRELLILPTALPPLRRLVRSRPEASPSACATLPKAPDARRRRKARAACARVPADTPRSAARPRALCNASARGVGAAEARLCISVQLPSSDVTSCLGKELGLWADQTGTAAPAPLCRTRGSSIRPRPTPERFPSAARGGSVRSTYACARRNGPSPRSDRAGQRRQLLKTGQVGTLMLVLGYP